jgi:sugar lactone lactonase YvrE
MLLAPSLALAQDMSVSGVLIDGQGWQLISDGYKFTEGPAADADGQVYFTDIPNNRIHKIGLDDKVSVFAEATANTNGLMFGPDGLLYGCRNGDKRIVAYDKDANMQTIAEDLTSNDLVVAGDGGIYVSDPPGGRIWYINPRREKKAVAEGLRPNGVILWPDQGTLVVTDGVEPVLWTFRVERDGSLTSKDRYYGPLQVPAGGGSPGSDGMKVDSIGRLYVTTRVGLQMFDPTGRLGGTILKPHAGPLSNVCFGGKNLDTLYVTAGDKVYKRRVQATGVRYAKPK